MIFITHISKRPRLAAFTTGVGRIMDFSCSYNTYPSSSFSAGEADAAAHASDWRAVGADLWSAIMAYKALGHDETQKVS
jgi:hypothetical protein